MTLGDEKFVIKIPASSANLGPGFDSIGLALDLYLQLEVEKSDKWVVIAKNDELNQFPSDEHNFICQTAIQTAAKFNVNLQPCKIKVKSDIPLARGLGSSASAIIAGIELADYLGELRLSKQEKLLIATELEGHPDNVGASLYGGLIIGCYQENDVDLLSVRNLSFETVAVIPKESLLTKDSRGVLPSVFSYSNAIQASATANLLVAALLSENWDLAGKMMKQDLFHQPYRNALIPFYDEVEEMAKAKGAFGVALSGAGPTLLCFCEKGKGENLANSLQAAFKDMSVKHLNIDSIGSVVYKYNECISR